MIFAGVLCALGLLFSWLAFLGWRHRQQESISLLEAGILMATGEEPLPLTRFDRWLQKFQLVMMGLLGPTLVGLGVVVRLDELGVV